MFQLLALQQNDDFFKPLSSRGGSGVFFCRFIGYDEDTMLFYRRVLDAAQKKGAYISKGLQNPTGPQVAAFSQAVNPGDFRPDPAYIAAATDRWLSAVAPGGRGLFAEAVSEMLGELARTGSNQNILKNAYVKFMCWAKYTFEGAIGGAGTDPPPKILYEGDITKYEVYMLRILSRAGCDVLYLNFNDDKSYLQCDPSSAYSGVIQCKRRGAPQAHFSTINLEGIEKAAKLRRQAETVKELVVTNTWMSGSILENVFKTGISRGPSTEVFYNLFGRYLGIGPDRDAYVADLYRFKLRLEEFGRPYVLQDSPLANPTLDEVKAIPPISYKKREELIAKLAAAAQVPQVGELTPVVQGALMRTLEQDPDETLPKLYNHGMKLLCWLRRYKDKLFSGFNREKPPVFLYYGVCNENEAEFLNLLSCMPVDVLLISPDKKAAAAFGSLGVHDRGVQELLENSGEVMPFPQQEPRLIATTAAYNAQKELEQILYTETGMFRHKQFTRCNPITLKTTYDEIEIYWRQEARYRPNFETGGGRVVVPNIFAKVNGVKDGDTVQYFRGIERLLTTDTILLNKIPYITAQTPNPVKAHVHKFFKNGEILPEAIQRDPHYQYDHLSDALQDFILEKIQMIIQWEIIQSHTQGVEYAILSTLLNLNRRTLRLIQEYEFTGQVPKVVVIDVDESMMSLEDGILLAFLNLAGFDIVVFTPTGYRNVEKHIRSENFEQYQLGKYCFNLRVPPMQLPAEGGGGGLLGRLFQR